MDGHQRQEFKVLYASVMTAAIYAGTFLTCFFWPSFLAYLFFPEELIRIELFAVFILLPLGLTVLGFVDGIKAGLAHLALAVLPIVISGLILLALGRDNDAEFAKSVIITVIALTYMIAALLASKRRVKTY